MFPGFDGLMTLSRREGVDIRPTLLRVITDMYVQTERHTAEEERQFVELTSRLIDQVDEPTRALVRARLSLYAQTPQSVAQQLSLPAAAPANAVSVEAIPDEAFEEPLAHATLAAEPETFSDVFFAASPAQRIAMLQHLEDSPPKPSMRPTDARAERALVVLEAAAFAGDIEGFVAELSAVLLLPVPVAARVVTDAGGEALACAAKSLAMPSDVFQRVLMFLDRSRGASVAWVYRLSRLYDVLTINTARSMVATWRGASFMQARARHQSMLHDDERHRARGAGSERPAARGILDTSRRVRDSRG
jgi:hypothetical protein